MTNILQAVAIAAIELDNTLNLMMREDEYTANKYEAFREVDGYLITVTVTLPGSKTVTVKELT